MATPGANAAGYLVDCHASGAARNKTVFIESDPGDLSLTRLQTACIVSVRPPSPGWGGHSNLALHLH